jgi:RNA recognition motif-containing protein
VRSKIDTIFKSWLRKRVLSSQVQTENKDKSSMEIYVGNLAYATTDDGLKAAFAAFGEVTAVRVVTDRMTGRSKGFGFITMPDAAQAQAAIDAMNGHELDGRTLRVNESQPKPREERGGFGGGRGGFGGGRGGFGGGRGGFGGGRGGFGDRGPRRETRW